MPRKITRQNAKSKGLKKYFTGKKCLYGHIAERDVSKADCVECQKIRRRKRYIKNKVSELKRFKEYREKYPERRKGTIRKYYLKHIKQEKKRRERLKKEHPEKIKLYNKRYRELHPDRVKKSHRKNFLKNMKNPTFRINSAMSSNLYMSLKGLKKGRSWEDLVDFNLDDLVNHLKRKLKSGMTMKNYGTYWHIDHKIPKAYFSYKTNQDPDFKRCWSLNNLEPLYGSENLKKNSVYKGIRYTKNVIK